MAKCYPVLKTLIAVILLASVPASSFADEITLVADEWCPYNCEPNSEKPGILIEIAQQAFAKYGHTIKYQILPWARAKDESRAGKFNGIVGAIKGDAPDFIFPDSGLVTLSNVFFVKKGSNWKFKSTSDLESVSLGVIRGYAYTDEIDAYIEKNKTNQKRIQLASGDDAVDKLVNKVAAGRVDVILEDRLVILSVSTRLNLASDLAEAGVAKSEPGYVTFSPAFPKSQEYAKILSQGFKELESSGKLKLLLARYGISEPK